VNKRLTQTNSGKEKGVERNGLNARIVLALVVLVTTGPASEWVVRYNGPGNGGDEAAAIA